MTTDLLKPSCDSKTRFRKSQKNTYGLLPGKEHSCPGATYGTGGCCHIPEGRKNRICYVDNLMKVYKAVGPLLQHNTELMKAANFDQKVELLNTEFSRFRRIENRQSSPMLYYRIHWSGDIYDKEYADALAKTMTDNSDIRFWCYTRSFFTTPILCDIPNLSLYLSLDPVNYAEGMSVYTQYNRSDRHLAVCYMAKENDFDKFETTVRDVLTEQQLTDAVQVSHAINPRYTACPVDTGKLKTEGGCMACGKCIRPGPVNVWFKT